MNTLRRYRDEHISQIITLFQDMQQRENEDGTPNFYADFDFSQEKVYKVLTDNANNIRFFGNIVLDSDEIVIAGLFAQVTTPLFSRDTIADEHVLVSYQGRASLKDIIRLIESYKEWAQRRSVKCAYLRTSTGLKQSSFEALCMRMGFLPFQYGYAWRIE